MTTRRTTATVEKPAHSLSREELGVLTHWLTHTRESNPDASSQGGRLLTRRGKLYYNPVPEDPEQRVCVGTARRGSHQVYGCHAMVPADLLEAVVAAAGVEVDMTPRVHQ